MCLTDIFLSFFIIRKQRNSKKIDFLKLGHQNDLFQILQNSQISFIKFRKSAKNYFLNTSSK